MWPRRSRTPGLGGYDTLHAEGLVTSIHDVEVLSPDEYEGDGDQKVEMEEEDQEAAGGAVPLQIPSPIGPSSSEEEEVVVVVVVAAAAAVEEVTESNERPSKRRRR